MLEIIEVGTYQVTERRQIRDTHFLKQKEVRIDQNMQKRQASHQLKRLKVRTSQDIKGKPFSKRQLQAREVRGQDQLEYRKKVS